MKWVVRPGVYQWLQLMNNSKYLTTTWYELQTTKTNYLCWHGFYMGRYLKSRDTAPHSNAPSQKNVYRGDQAPSYFHNSSHSADSYFLLALPDAGAPSLPSADCSFLVMASSLALICSSTESRSFLSSSERCWRISFRSSLFASSSKHTHVNIIIK